MVSRGTIGSPEIRCLSFHIFISRASWHNAQQCAQQWIASQVVCASGCKRNMCVG